MLGIYPRPSGRDRYCDETPSNVVASWVIDSSSRANTSGEVTSDTIGAARSSGPTIALDKVATRPSAHAGANAFNVEGECPGNFV